MSYSGHTSRRISLSPRKGFGSTMTKANIALPDGNAERRREHRLKPNRDAKAREKGYILLTSALSIFVLLGFVGLAVDVGFLQFQKRRIQSATDAAAAGAALQLAAQASHDMARSEGLYDSKKNGFENTVNGVTVTINIPPTIG